MAPRRTQAVLALFLPPAVAALTVLGVMYINSQQMLRLSANEPVIRAAEDFAATTDNVLLVTPSETRIPIETSLSTYLVLYDSFGAPVSGTGYLHGELPTLPPGVFDVARSKGSDVITWQPEEGVRAAIAVVPVNGGAGGYVLAGHSLRFIEEEASLLGMRTLVGSITALLALFAAAFFTARFLR